MSNNSLKIALLQIDPFDLDQGANLRKGCEFCHRAQQQGADIVVFPELWSIGYQLWEMQDQLPLYAIEKQSAFVTTFQSLAKELKIAIAITYLESWLNAPRNTVSLIDRYGKIVLHYAKVHTCDFDVEAKFTSGNDFYVCDLDTAKGNVKIGAMICFDREFPESARILMLKGAEIILIPNACNIDVNRYNQLHARAFENMVGIALANYPQPKFNGHSVALSGIAYDDSGKALEMKIVQADDRESIMIADFDLKKLREYQRCEVWGKNYRKPKVYDTLVVLE